MSTICVVQARTGSSRLPRKVLADLGGMPMLAFMLQRLEPLAVDRLVVATSTLAQDDEVVDVATTAGVSVIRGSEQDVLGRFATVLATHPAAVVVRLTADCPLVDPAVVNDAIALRAATGADYASNTLIRTFPDGLDVEVVTAEAVRQAAEEAVDPAEREHVTPFVYRRPERYRLAALRSGELLGHERWTVDTAADLEWTRNAVGALSDPATAGWRDVVAAVGLRCPAAGPGCWLRPAVENDDSVIAAMAEDHSAVGIGTGDTPAPIRTHLSDPSLRTWVGEVTSEPVGWAQVLVRNGVGRLSGRVASRWREAFLGGLSESLKEDYQVRELEGA